MPIFHDDVTFILKEEIPHVTKPYIDDVPVKGPKSRYELPEEATRQYLRTKASGVLSGSTWEMFVECCKGWHTVGEPSLALNRSYAQRKLW